jgi:riboflavin biosynthesis pyrimidine reductase
LLSGELIKEKLLDEYYLFISPKIFGDINSLPSVLTGPLGKIADSFEFTISDHCIIGNDLMLRLKTS